MFDQSGFFNNQINNNERGVVIYARSDEAAHLRDDIGRMDAGRGLYKVRNIYTDMSSDAALQEILRSTSTIVVVHHAVDGWSSEMIQRLVHERGESARIVISIVPPIGGWFDASAAAGATPFKVPLGIRDLESIDEHYDHLMTEAIQRTASAADAPLPVPKVDVSRSVQQMVGYQTRQRLNPMAVWSSKGGDGKSIIAMELAYMLGIVGGKKVLLIDADMTRGYFKPTLSKPSDPRVPEHASKRNIVTLASYYHAKKVIPSLEGWVYNYPHPNAKGGQTNLDIIFGLQKIGDQGIPGLQDMDFATALYNAAGDYEFLVADIGTDLSLPTHQSIIKNSANVLIVMTPIIASAMPTKDGIERMEEERVTSKSRMTMVINKYVEKNPVAKTTFEKFMGLPVSATIPVIPPETMYGFSNTGRFATEAFLSSNDFDDLADFCTQVLNVAELYSPGIRAKAQRDWKKLEKAVGKSRTGFFGIGGGKDKK